VLYFLALIASTYKRFKDNAYERERERDQRETVLKAVSLCIRARSWAVLPVVAPSDALEDASGWMVALDARADV